MWQPYLYYNGTNLLDQTITLSDFFTGSVSDSLGGGKYLYISSNMPFRTTYFALGADAVTNQTLSCEYYAGTTHGWVSTTYMRDATAGLSNSGYVTIQPDKNKPWTIIPDTTDVAELNGVTLYNMYWSRFSLSAETSVSLKWIGHKFCSTEDIYRQHPSLNRQKILDAFESGKTDWEDQIIVASELIIEDLRKLYSIESQNQIADSVDLRSACVSRTAAIIWAGLGDVGVDNAERAMVSYREEIKAGVLSIDQDKNGIISPDEKLPRQSMLVR